MRAREFIFEALKPSEYRQYVKGWDKSRWASLFNRKYRLYFPLESSSYATKPNQQVVDFLSNNGFTIKDYAKNLAVDNNGREKRIGSIVSKNPTIKQYYDNDPARQGGKVKEKQIVVISRHPYDIASMSTDRGWTSCMNIHDGINNHYIPIEIEAGTIIAYLIDSNDRNINNPSARVLIKPFISVDSDEWSRKKISDNDIVLGISKKVYGNASPEFVTTVQSWVNSVNRSRYMNGVFTVDPSVYWDTKGEEEEVDRPEPVRYKDGEKIKKPKSNSGDIYIGIYNSHKLYISLKYYEKYLDFADAKKYINNLNINGNTYTLPTSDEMQFIYDNRDKIESSDELERDYYYTVDDEGEANLFDVDYGEITDWGVSTYKEHYVRGIRKE